MGFIWSAAMAQPSSRAAQILAVQAVLVPRLYLDPKVPSLGRVEETCGVYHACSVTALRLTNRGLAGGKQEAGTVEREELREDRKTGKDIPPTGTYK